MFAPRERQGVLQAVAFGAEETWRWTRLTVEFLGRFVTGRESMRNVGGPIMIGQISGEAAQQGPDAFISFMALLSINLAVLNLLPIPVLDGGHLVFLAIEGVRGRALSLQQRIRLTQVGMVLILGLMVLAFGNDILRLFGR
jgi:regulator of sigma E protease